MIGYEASWCNLVPEPITIDSYGYWRHSLTSVQSLDAQFGKLNSLKHMRRLFNKQYKGVMRMHITVLNRPDYAPYQSQTMIHEFITNWSIPNGHQIVMVHCTRCILRIVCVSHVQYTNTMFNFSVNDLGKN